MKQPKSSLTSVFHRRLLRDLRSVVSNTLAKNLRLRCAVAAAADPRWRCDIVVRVGGWDRRVLDAGGEMERCHGDEVVDYYYHSITHHGFVCVLAYVGITRASLSRT